jgi:hypothetical protein
VSTPEAPRPINPSWSGRPIPARRRSKAPLVVGLVLAVIVLAVAIGGGVFVAFRAADEDRDDRAGGDDGSVEVDGLTADQRSEALLTIDDVGPGLTEDPPFEGDDEPDEAGAGIGIDDPECADVFGEMDEEGASPLTGDGEPPGSAVRSFTGDSANSIAHLIGPDTDLVDLYRRLIDTCAGVAIDDGMGGTARFVAGDPIAVGDDSVVLDLTLSLQSGGREAEFVVRTVVWSRDGNDSLVAYSPGGDPASRQPLPIDPAELERLVTLADERLAAVIDAA